MEAGSGGLIKWTVNLFVWQERISDAPSGAHTGWSLHMSDTWLMSGSGGDNTTLTVKFQTTFHLICLFH